MNIAHEYRLKEVMELKTFLEGEIKHHHKFHSKYKKMITAFSVINNLTGIISVGSSIGGLAMFATIINIPAGIALESVAIVSSLINWGMTIGNSKVLKKLSKHEHLRVSALSCLN